MERKREQSPNCSVSVDDARDLESKTDAHCRKRNQDHRRVQNLTENSPRLSHRLPAAFVRALEPN